MTEDGEWMRDVFDTTRGEAEPIWYADTQAIIGGGDRRRRLRTVGAGSGSLAVVAAAATIAVSLAGPAGGGRSTTAPPTTSLATSGTPSAPPTTLSDGTVLERVNFLPGQDKIIGLGGNVPPKTMNVPEPAVADMGIVLAGLDPTSSHIVPMPNRTTPAKAVPFGDAQGDNYASLDVASFWTPNGKPPARSGIANHPVSPTGNLLTRFLDGDDAKFQPAMPGCGVADELAVPWNQAAAWSACDHRQLADGSVLASSTKSLGKLTAIFVMRQFPGGAGTVESFWENYTMRQAARGIEPNPDTVISPSPLTVQDLARVLSGGIAPGLKPAAAVTVPPTLLQAADFGTGWNVDVTGTPNRPSTLVTDACASVHKDLLGPTVPDYAFSGPTPSGLNVRADVLRLTVKSGTGAQKLAALRQQAETGCGDTTVTSLPSGIGDGGFVESIPELPSKTWNVFVRFGDVVIQVDVNSPEGSSTFTQADKQWVTGLGAKIATRFAATG
ncbi:hypothetical protein [Catenulispora rubra]|uniref:hypothetical protein n=1 Tax=Catenulispora rubra TaxID=280293 RepID=UPI001892111F|nr:hypothetical protein [Catenulispora rubra]